MIWIAITVVIQAACIGHLIRHDRNRVWIAVILLLPLIGSTVYFLLEIVPTLSAGQPAELARVRTASAPDPKRELRAARDALYLADTAANRVRLADGLCALNQYAEAMPLYREALGMMRGDDPATQVKLARALFENNHAAEALATIEAVPLADSKGEADRRAFLQAQILAYLGHREEALAIFADIVTRLPGEEARCHYAALLLKCGQRARARAVLEAVETRVKRIDRTKAVAERPMYDWALRELAKLRA